MPTVPTTKTEYTVLVHPTLAERALRALQALTAPLQQMGDIPSDTTVRFTADLLAGDVRALATMLGTLVPERKQRKKKELP